MGLGDLLKEKEATRRAELAKWVYKVFENVIDCGYFRGDFTFDCGYDLKITVEEILPHIATELAEAGFYIHLTTEYLSLYTRESKVGVAFELVQKQTNETIKPSGKKINFNGTNISFN